MSNPIHIHIPQSEGEDYPLGEPIPVGSSLIAAHYMHLSAWLARKNNDYAVSVLRDAGIRYAEISYSGCGDSGQIDCLELLSAAREPVNVEGGKAYDIRVYKAEQSSLDVSLTDLPASHYLDSVITIDPVVPDPRPADWNWPRYDRKEQFDSFMAGTLDRDLFCPRIRTTKITQMFFSRELNQIAETFGYNLMEIHHPGFEINDGGCGEISFDLETGGGTYEKTDYFTDSSTETFEFAAGDH